jgi:hypothetical protein
MGLENGIIIRGVKRKDLPFLMRYPFDQDYNDNEVEICYWRKYWGLRNWFLKEAFPNEFHNKSYYKLDVEKVRILKRIIIYYLQHPEDWDNRYWEYKHAKHILYNQRWNLFLLIFWMLKHPDAEVIFYDSY